MLWMVPPLMLLLVAAHQRWRVRTIGQTAWKGGGFAVFSDIDRNSIGATLWVRESDGIRACQIEACPPQSRATNVPTDENILRWGREIAKTRWQTCGGTAHPWLPSTNVAPVVTDRIELRRLSIDFDGRAGAYTARTVKTYTVVPEPGGAR